MSGDLAPVSGTIHPARISHAAGSLTALHLGRHAVVLNDDGTTERARGVIDKIGHERDFHGDSVTWLGLRGEDDWRWYKRIPATTPIWL